jgi:hypothetical protein
MWITPSFPKPRIGAISSARVYCKRKNQRKIKEAEQSSSKNDAHRHREGAAVWGK